MYEQVKGEGRKETRHLCTAGDSGGGQASPQLSGMPTGSPVTRRGPYRDVVVQRLAIQPLILHSDVQEVDLTARHHDANQGPVLCSCSLKRVHQGCEQGPPHHSAFARHSGTFLPIGPVSSRLRCGSPHTFYPESLVPVTGGARHPPPRPCMWELRTLMALLSLSAKKAGVFLRHFTIREKHSITRCAGNYQSRGHGVQYPLRCWRLSPSL